MRLHIILITLLLPAAALADVRCLPEDTPRQCTQRLIAARAWETAQADLGAANKGTDIAGTPIRSAVKDFLTVASAHVDGSTVKDSGTALTVDYNLPVHFFDERGAVNLEATLPDTVVSAPVAAETATTTAPPPEQLNRGDDVSATLSFNPFTRRFGISLDPHRALFDSMLGALVANAPPSTAAVQPASFDTPFAQLFPDAAARVTAMAEFETAALAPLPAAADQLTKDLTRLALNQPQIVVSGRVHHRKPEVGANERELSVRWEIGTDNLNSFRRAEGADCEAHGTCLAAFSDYTRRTAAEHRSDHLALIAGYRKTDANDPGLTTPPATELAANGFTYSAAYGREITSAISGRRGRIDVGVSFDGKQHTHTTSVTEPQSRTVATAVFAAQLLPPPRTRYAAAATVTQPISDWLAGSLSLVHASREQSLPGNATVPLPISPVTPGNGHTAPFSTTQSSTDVHVGITLLLPSFPRPSAKPPSGCCCCK